MSEYVKSDAENLCEAIYDLKGAVETLSEGAVSRRERIATAILASMEHGTSKTITFAVKVADDLIKELDKE